ncbi:MFS transporter [Streptomyces sp. L7]
MYTASAPLAYAITRDVFPRSGSGSPAGSWPAGSVSSPSVDRSSSGWLLDDYGFRGVLWFMAISTAVSFLLVLAFVPESLDPRCGRPDGLGRRRSSSAAGSRRSSTPSARACTGAGAAAVHRLGRRGGDRPDRLRLRGAQGRRTLFPLSMTRRRPVWTVLPATSIAAGSLSAVGVVIQLLILMPKIPTISEGPGGWSGTHNAIVTSPISAMIIIGAVGTGLLSRPDGRPHPAGHRRRTRGPRLRHRHPSAPQRPADHRNGRDRGTGHGHRDGDRAHHDHPRGHPRGTGAGQRRPDPRPGRRPDRRLPAGLRRDGAARGGPSRAPSSISTPGSPTGSGWWSVASPRARCSSL